MFPIEVDGNQARVSGQHGAAGRQRKPGHLGGPGQGHRQRRRRSMLHHTLLRRPRGARISVGGRKGRSCDVDQIGVAGSPGAPGLGDQIRQARTLPGAHPDDGGDVERDRDG